MKDTKADALSDVSLGISILSVALGLAGTYIVNSSDGWGAIAGHYIFIFVLSLVVIIVLMTGVVAIINGTNKKLQTLASMLIALSAIFIFTINIFGGL